MLVMLDIIAEESDEMYKAGQDRERKQKRMPWRKASHHPDVRHSDSHIFNKPHGLIAASKFPKVESDVQSGDQENS